MRQRAAVLLLALGLVAAACSGEVDEGVASLAASEEPTVIASNERDQNAEPVDQEQAMLAFASCMRDNGVDIEDPTVDSEGNVQFGGFRGAAQQGEFDRETMRAVMDECAEYLEGISLGRGGGDFDLTELQDTLIDYAACMRANGFDMPDPDFSGFGPGDGEPGEGGGGPFGAIDFDDPDFLSAQEACEDVLGNLRAPGSGPGRGGGPGG